MANETPYFTPLRVGSKRKGQTRIRALLSPCAVYLLPGTLDLCPQ